MILNIYKFIEIIKNQLKFQKNIKYLIHITDFIDKFNHFLKEIYDMEIFKFIIQFLQNFPQEKLLKEFLFQ